MSATTISFTSLGTTWWIELFDKLSTERRDELAELITALVRSIEDRFSRFKTDSLVTTLNTNRHLVSIDPDLHTLITIGQDLYQKTGGIFNCLLGSHLEARGYDAVYSFHPTAEPSLIPNPLTDITITANTITLSAGKLDCGGYGKGWAIDCVAALLTREGVKEFLINAGGDMYGTSEDGTPISIYLEHPVNPGEHIGATHLWHQGFAASSRTKRQWKHSGRTYSHIVDTSTPSALPPSDMIDGVFVKAPLCVTADAFATTGLITSSATLFTLAASHELGLALYSTATTTLQTNVAFSSATHRV